jgi:CDP-diacylglycerol--glycerol-3-phosphate 3-phosphatidyltransferase
MKLIHRGENILNVPNLLSFYRLIVFPVILIFAVQELEKLFVIFLCISLITDVLDGFIARKFNVQTRFGLALDNLADIGTLFTALYGMFVFKWDAFRDHAWLLYIFLAIFLISYIVAFLRFKKIPGLHLYLSVTSGYLQGIFFFVLFAWDFVLWFYYLAVGTGIVAYIEKILVLVKLNDIRPGVKGLYWLMKKERQKDPG